MIFDIENSLWKSNFRTFDELAKLGKASQDTYNPGGWLILQALLKSGVAEGVTSDPHDTSVWPRHMQKSWTWLLLQARRYRLGEHLWCLLGILM